ncbi:MAG: hypothetical protein R3A11_06390 [Bdellovibrionota bacterium]
MHKHPPEGKIMKQSSFRHLVYFVSVVFSTLQIANADPRMCNKFLENISYHGELMFPQWLQLSLNAEKDDLRLSEDARYKGHELVLSYPESIHEHQKLYKISYKDASSNQRLAPQLHFNMPGYLRDKAKTQEMLIPFLPWIRTTHGKKGQITKIEILALDRNKNLRDVSSTSHTDKAIIVIDLDYISWLDVDSIAIERQLPQLKKELAQMNVRIATFEREHELRKRPTETQPIGSEVENDNHERETIDQKVTHQWEWLYAQKERLEEQLEAAKLYRKTDFESICIPKSYVEKTPIGIHRGPSFEQCYQLSKLQYYGDRAHFAANKDLFNLAVIKNRETKGQSKEYKALAFEDVVRQIQEQSLDERVQSWPTDYAAKVVKGLVDDQNDDFDLFKPYYTVVRKMTYKIRPQIKRYNEIIETMYEERKNPSYFGIDAENLVRIQPRIQILEEKIRSGENSYFAGTGVYGLGLRQENVSRPRIGARQKAKEQKMSLAEPKSWFSLWWKHDKKFSSKDVLFEIKLDESYANLVYEDRVDPEHYCWAFSMKDPTYYSWYRFYRRIGTVIDVQKRNGFDDTADYISFDSENAF